ncbi:DUF397 domain-containing protein [Streptomyces sp. NPDC059897]|uniref:DUF397 domain-containing protein n=1 Tax=Streptomyces sp. NPDC059897 TaxID=3346994 RepID=UPI00365A6C4F
MNARLTWFKSSYSDSQGGECLEAARTPARIHVRDSKLGRQSPSFSAGPGAWNRFLDRVRSA